MAIKLLHREPAGASATPELEREARALARLSHPNVVTVHELGCVDGRPFCRDPIVVENFFIQGSWVRFGRAAERAEETAEEAEPRTRGAGAGGGDEPEVGPVESATEGTEDAGAFPPAVAAPPVDATPDEGFQWTAAEPRPASPQALAAVSEAQGLLTVARRPGAHAPGRDQAIGPGFRRNVR